MNHMQKYSQHSYYVLGIEKKSTQIFLANYILLVVRYIGYILTNALSVIIDNNNELIKPLILFPKPPRVPSKHIKG